MKVRLGNLVGVLGSLLVFVGTLGVASPMCVGWFYSPKVPEELKEQIFLGSFE
ncbi:MAG: cyclic lactone autoinducer peptide [Dethiobacteria bacterium]